MNFIGDFSSEAAGKKDRLGQIIIATLGAFLGVALFVVALLLAAIAYIALVPAPAHARDGGQWGDQPASVRQWFQSLTQPDNPYMSCCGEADAYEADQFDQDSGGHYVAVITDGKGTIPNGTRIIIPDAKIKWDKGNPTGHGIVFIGPRREVYCYVTPGGV